MPDSLPTPHAPAPSFDVIVVGGGHAGCEAACVAARMGARTALVTHSRTTIGVMSCNPAFGGLGKGQLLREIDAFDGVSPQAADAATIMAKVLNRSRGPAVRGPRVQADRKRYQTAMNRLLASQTDLCVVEGTVTSLSTVDMGSNGIAIKGILLASGQKLQAEAIVLTTGTFLGGRILRGYRSMSGGRLCHGASVQLPQQLQQLSLPLNRFRTGTPPRLIASSINTAVLPVQHGESNAEPLSRQTPRVNGTEVVCHVTQTNPHTHTVIDQFRRHASASWHIGGKPPRYCPSIEDKIRRFAQRESHTIFLEPEGAENNPLIYPNGIASSLPPAAQLAFLKTIDGLSKVRVHSYAYTIEYGYVDPTVLLPTLACRSLSGLWLAGQINGTTGYEEAAALGLVAGINAALFAGACGSDRQFRTYVPSRSEANLGVLIDDLVNKGVTEPYRMLTCRAEYRLQLRADNADLRLCDQAHALGCLSSSSWKRFQQFERELHNAQIALNNHPKLKKDEQAILNASSDLPQRSFVHLERALADASIPDERIGQVWSAFPHFSGRVREQLRCLALYAPYLEKQRRDIAMFSRDEGLPIPPDLDFHVVPGLSTEARQSLARTRPGTIGAAQRCPGISSSSLLSLGRYLRKHPRTPRLEPDHLSLSGSRRTTQSTQQPIDHH